MSNIIATWICLDTEDTASFFPSSKGMSSDKRIQNIYWRCVISFFSTAKFYNPEARLVLFSNTSELPIIDGVCFQSLFNELNIEFHTTSFEFIPPTGYFGNWRNQFYEFSIFKYVCTHTSFSKEDNFLLLDSDCIINGNLDPVFSSIEKESCITYIFDYPETHVINGITRIQMKEIFEALLDKPLETVPAYHAGEFFGSSVNALHSLNSEFENVWEFLLARHKLNLTKLNEEAHVLSYLYFKCNYEGGQGNKYIKRLWTDPSTFRNVQKGDEQLLIWHLPAEKRTGFKVFFNWLKEKSFHLNRIDESRLKEKCKTVFKIPIISAFDKMFFTGKLIAKKLVPKK